MHGQNVQHGTALLVHYAASQLNGVISSRPLDEGVAFRQRHILQAEQRQVELHDGPAHLHGGMAGLRVHAARVGHAHRQIHVPHHLAVDNVRHLVDGQCLKGLAVGELHPLQRGGLHVARGEPVRQGVNSGHNILLIKDLLQPFLVIRHPAPPPQAGHRLFRLNLITREQPGIPLPHLLGQLHVQLPEHLLEGLLHLVLEEPPLIIMPVARPVKVQRMGDPQRLILSQP